MTFRLIATSVAVLFATGTAFSQAQMQTASPGERLAARFIDASRGLCLEDAIARALDREPTLRMVRAEIEMARGMRVQAGLRPSPSASFERRAEPGGSDNQTMIGIEWPLDLFRKAGRTAVAERELKASELRAADRTRLVAGDVRTRYGEALGALRDLSVLDELVDVTTRQVDAMRARVEEGATPPLERDVVDVELRRLEAERLLQLGETEAAIFELKRALAMEPSAPLTFREDLEHAVLRDGVLPPATRSDADVVLQRADVREAQSRVAIADAKVDRAQREGRFDVSLFGGYMRMDSGFAQFGLGPAGTPERVRGVFHYATAGANVTLPIFNRNQGDIAAARAERTGAAAAVEAARLTAEVQIASARARETRARETVTAYGRGARDLARQNLAVVRQSSELGRLTVFDVLAEQRRYLDVERGYSEALRAAFEARTALTLALGEVR